MTTAKNWVKKLFLLGYNLKSGGADKILVDGFGGGGGGGGVLGVFFYEEIFLGGGDEQIFGW